MKKIKYYYNTNTLRYEKLETPLRVKLLRVLGFISAAIVTAVIIVSIAYRYFPSANEKRLMQQNEDLTSRLVVLYEQTRKLNEQMAVLEKKDNEVYRAIFEANPIPDSARAKELEYQNEIQLVQRMNQFDLESSIIQTLNNVNRRMHSQERSYAQIDQFIKNKE